MNYRILVLNFGSTSTKVGIYNNAEEEVRATIQHPAEELKRFADLAEQLPYRKAAIDGFIAKNGTSYDAFDAVISRGGNCRPVPSGIYLISPQVLADLESGEWGVHPTNMGNRIAYDIGTQYGIPALFADPPLSDEFIDLARFSGIKEIERISSLHVLNQKAIARRYAKSKGRNYEDMDLVVVHMGGGISVGAHRHGSIIDANNALNGDGPFAPERAGALPNSYLIKMCFSGKYTQGEMLKKMTGAGGLMSYLGTSDAMEVERRIEEGDEYAAKVYEAMAYQTAKEIGSAACVLEGKAEAIIYTASLAKSARFTNMVTQRVGWIAPVVLMPGEDELLALAERAALDMAGAEPTKDYSIVGNSV